MDLSEITTTDVKYMLDMAIEVLVCSAVGFGAGLLIGIFPTWAYALAGALAGALLGMMPDSNQHGTKFL